jgi:hypothetical protein
VAGGRVRMMIGEIREGFEIAEVAEHEQHD